MTAEAHGEGVIKGRVSPGWEPVRDVFAANLARRGEVGAAVAMYHRGELVVDLWAGLADPTTGRRWTGDTPVVCFSVTKGLVAACFLLLEDRGRVDLDAPVAEYWPELGRGDKATVTPRLILNHRAGLSAIDVPLALTDVLTDPARVHDALVRQAPLWAPGTDQGYAACSYGLYTAELFRRIAGRSLGAFFAEEIARPLGIDAQISLGRPRALAEPPALLLPNGLGTLLSQQLPTALFRANADGRLYRRVLLGGRSDAGRALLNPTLGPRRFEALNDPEILELELPWINALCTARGLARLYAPLAGDGSVDGVRLVNAASLLPLRPRQGWSERDRVLQKPIGWSQGFVKDEPHLFTPSPRAFGHPGAGGALGWADPDRELSIGYVMNRMDWRIRSPRAVALAQAGAACADRSGVDRLGAGAPA